MIPIITPAEMREIDANAPETLDELIARAAWHVARNARQMLGGVYGRRVIAIAGPGNNGADARVAAGILRRWGVHVEIVAPDTKELAPADLVIDGAFGTGTNRAYEPPHVADGVPILAVDSPSGLDGLTGEAMGHPLGATRTVTFAGLKPGLLLGDGPDLAGQVDVVALGLDTSSATAWLVTEGDVAPRLPRRRRSDHKWKRGVYVVGGSPGMYGAPFLASSAALRSGAGIVWCGLPGQPPPGTASEIVFKDLPASGWGPDVLRDSSRFGSVVIGCGMGAEHSADVAVVAGSCPKPIVIDGGGLRALGRLPQLAPHVVLTPHDAEFESLAGERPGPDRFAATRSLAERTGATVLLKGPLTIVAAPDGTCLASAAGDERLATAGSGDVLAGVIGALLAGGLEPLWAAAIGTWLHGAAGQQGMPHGFVASDLLDGLRQVTNQLLGR
jgi:NAD(P)H-hydrate epimerase